MSAAHELLRRHRELLAEQESWRGHWRECAEFVKPRKGEHGGSPGSKRHGRVYDGTAEHALDVLAAGLHAGLTNPDMKWFRLVLPDPEAMEADSARFWLSEVEDRLYDALARSNFASEIHEAYLDLGCFGTACLSLEEDHQESLRFSARPLAEIAVAEDSRGRVDTVFRRFSLTARQALQEWGDHAGPTAQRLARRDPDRKIAFLHAVHPRIERSPQRRDAANKPYASTWIDVEGGEVVAASGYDEMPFMVARWSTSPGEVYGRGPAMKALADIKMLNEMEKDNIVAAQLRNRPPLLVPDDGYASPVRLIPGALNYYRAGSTDSIRPLLTGMDAPFTVEMAERKAKQVRQAFLVDVFLMLESRPNITATEVLERRQEKLLILGPTLGRLQNELLTPLLSRAFSILSRRGELPEPPPELAGRTMRPVFTGPLSLAMRNTEVEAITRAYALAGQVAQVQGTEVLDNLDPDEALREGFERIGAPPSVLRPREGVKKLRNRRAKDAEQAAQALQLAPEPAPAPAQPADPVQAALAALSELNPLAQGGEA